MTLKLVFTALLLESKLASLIVTHLEKALKLTEIVHLEGVDRWPATPERARYNA